MNNEHTHHKLVLAADVISAHLPPAVAKVAILGGGALRSAYDGTHVRDYDLFFRSELDFIYACNQMQVDGWLQVQAASLPRAPVFMLCGHPDIVVNLVGFRFKDTVRDTAEAFDFRCCAHAISLADYEEFYQVPGAVEDATERRLVFQTLQQPKRVLKRAARYINAYGYTITDEFIDRLPECYSVPVDDSPDYG